MEILVQLRGLSSKKACENACCSAFWLVIFQSSRRTQAPLPSRMPAGCAWLWRTKTAIQRCGCTSVIRQR